MVTHTKDMYIETRIIRKKKKYYLVHSCRENNQVKKIRRYLGVNLTEKQIKKLLPSAEAGIKQQIALRKTNYDPLKTIISDHDLKELEALISPEDIFIEHLNKKQWELFTSLFTYDTNAIEGSTLTFKEVKDILAKNKWPENKAKEDIAEAYGVKEAIIFIKNTDEHISLEIIKNIHSIIFKNSKLFAGKFREKGIEVGVTDSYGNIVHRGALSTQVVSLLKELIKWYNKYKQKYHPIILAAVVHNQFENIHPFQDGNGRVGRVLMNNILLKYKLPALNITLNHRQEYYQTLQAYQRFGDLRPTLKFMMKEYRELKRRLR